MKIMNVKYIQKLMRQGAFVNKKGHDSRTPCWWRLMRYLPDVVLKRSEEKQKITRVAHFSHGGNCTGCAGFTGCTECTDCTGCTGCVRRVGAICTVQEADMSRTEESHWDGLWTGASGGRHGRMRLTVLTAATGVGAAATVAKHNELIHRPL